MPLDSLTRYPFGKKPIYLKIVQTMRLHHSLAILLAICVMPLVAKAQTASLELNSTIPLDPQVRTGKLANGLTYYVRHNAKPEHRAELRLIVHAGSILENDNQRGLAHFNEHMAFNGTKRYPKNDLESFLESHGARFGADLNASTSFDETIYKLTLPTDQGPILDSGLEILNEWAHYVTYDSVEMEKERGVVGEEWRMGRGAQERIMNEQLPIILHGSKYAERLPIGKKPVLDTAHLSYLTSFYHDWYRPDLMAVIAVGDFDATKMEEAIKTMFAPLSNPDHERPLEVFPVPPHSETLVTISTDKETPQTLFTMYLKRPHTEISSVADFKHRLSIALYNDMVNSRIEELLQKGAATFSYAGTSDSRFLGNVQVYSTTVLLPQDSIEKGIRTALREVYRAKQNGFAVSELERAKKSLMSSMEKRWKEKGKTESGNFVREYTNLFLHHQPAPGLDYEHALYAKYLPLITVNEVNALSHELMENTSRVLAFAAPDSKEIHVPTKEQLLSIVEGVEKEHLAPYVDMATNEPLMKSAPKPGKIIGEEKHSDLGLTIWKLSNGARVIVKPTEFKDDEILFHATSSGGSSVAPDSDYVSADNANDIVENSGLADFDATTLTKMLAGKEVEVSPYINSLQQGFNGHSTKSDLETMMQLAHLSIAKPRYDSVACASYLARMYSFLENRSKEPEAAFQDTLEVTLAQHNYRSRPFTADVLKEVNPQKAFTYYKRLFGDAGAYTYYFVGNVELASLKPLVEKYLASLPSLAHHEFWTDNGIRPPKGVIVKNVEKGSAPKSIVEMVFSGDAPFSRENRFQLGAMAQAFEIKLREDIREDKSGVYYVSVRPSLERYPIESYRITIQFGCDPTRVNELVAEVMKQIDTLTSSQMAPTYIERVKKIQANEYETNLTRNNYWMGKLQDVYWNEIQPTTILKANDLIDAFTPKQALETAKRYFNKQNYVQVVLYPEKKP